MNIINFLQFISFFGFYIGVDKIIGKKYEGITSNYIDWGVYFYEGLEKSLVNYIKTEISVSLIC